MLQIGDTVERYVVEAVLGQGGVATVLRVRHTDLQSLHALKILSVGNASTRERLLAEGRAQARLIHPNVVRVTDMLRVGDTPCLVMEFIDGPSLDEVLKNNPPTVHEALFIFRGIARGVAAAHRRHIVHRDLKPANVMLAFTDQGLEPKVADFGLVKVLSGGPAGTAKTRDGASMGTPHYMSPEQARDAGNVDHRTDIWSLGVILYELLCGERPFQGEGMLEVLNAVATAKYIPPKTLVPELSNPVCSAIDKMLQPDADDRYDSVDDLLGELFDEGAIGSGIRRKKSIAITRLIDDEPTPLNLEDGPTLTGPPPLSSARARPSVVFEHAVALLFVASALGSFVATVLTRGAG